LERRLFPNRHRPVYLGDYPALLPHGLACGCIYLHKPIHRREGEKPGPIPRRDPGNSGCSGQATSSTPLQVGPAHKKPVLTNGQYDRRSLWSGDLFAQKGIVI